MPEKYIITHDMGTSSDKVLLTTVFGEIIDTAKKTYHLSHPKPGYAEQNPLDWWDAVCDNTRTVLKKSGVEPKDVVGVTFASQMQNLIPVSESGEPLTPAMSWLDVRSAEILKDTLWTAPRVLGFNIFRLLKFLKITGGTPGHTGKDIIAKMLWLKKNKPDIFAQTYKFIDAKDFIIYKLTGKFVTSVDLAVIWWLLDTRKNKNEWHSGLCKIPGITPERLAEVKESAAIAGELTPEAAAETGLLPGTPIINGAGDLSASALGSGAIDNGELHIRIGTSGGVAGHFTKRKIDLAHYAGCIGSTWPKKYYLGLAHQETAGLCLEWLKTKVLYHEEQLKEEGNVSEIFQLLDQLAESAPPGSDGLMFTPWLFGERCPLDDNHVRGGLYNIGLNHSREHIVRAVFEGVAFNTRWAMETLENLYDKVDELNIIGGGAKSSVWCQIIADVTNRNINQVSDPQEAAGKGVALLASMSLGYIKSFEEIKKYIKIEKQYNPNPANRSLYDKMYAEFRNVYKQNKKWYARMNNSH